MSDTNNLLEEIKNTLNENMGSDFNEICEAIYQLMEDSFIDFGNGLLDSKDEQATIERFNHWAKKYKI